MLNRSFDCAFADAEELIYCAQHRKNHPKPKYMAAPILRRIPSLAIKKPIEQAADSV